MRCMEGHGRKSMVGWKRNWVEREDRGGQEDRGRIWKARGREDAFHTKKTVEYFAEMRTT